MSEIIKFLSQLLARHSYLPLVPVKRTDQIQKLESHIVELWKTKQYTQCFIQISTAWAAGVFLKIGFKLNQAPYLVKLILYSVRGQALLSIYRPDIPVRLPKSLHSKPESQEFDYIIIGSGAAGSTVAHHLSQSGKKILLLEEGAWIKRENFQQSTLASIQTLFRAQGLQFARGKSLIPVLQGSCVGGTTVINGAICHPLPKPIYDNWVSNFGMSEAFSWEELNEVYNELSIHLRLKTHTETLSTPEFPLHQFLARQNWRYQMMNRSAPDCQETGRCLQGCPTGAKLSMENSLIPKSLECGATLLPNHKVTQIVIDKNQARGVRGVNHEGRFHYTANKAIILAAGAVHSPWLLAKSGIDLPHLGQHFQCHLGVSCIAELPFPYRAFQGPLQGTEITQFKDDKIKLATQLIPIELLYSRTDMDPTELVGALESAEFYSAWMGSIQSESEGHISLGKNPKIHFEPSSQDLVRLSKSLNHLKTLFEGMQATKIFPGILNPKALNFSNPELLGIRDFLLGIGHIFGTCRMGSSSANSVTDYQFKVHGLSNLYCCDASIFPTNIGVNPQMAIMSLARIAAKRILKHLVCRDT